MKKDKSCGAIIFKKENDCLYTLLVRHNAGHWGFPKGHPKKGETEEETAIREVKEETGIQIKIKDSFRDCTKYSPKEDVEKEVIYFIGNVKGGKLKSQEGEIQDTAWVTIHNAYSLLTFLNDIALLKKVYKHLEEKEENYD